MTAITNTLGRAVIAQPTPQTIDRAAAWQVRRAITHTDTHMTSPEHVTAKAMVESFTGLIAKLLR